MSCANGETKEVDVVSIEITDKLGQDSTLYFLDKIDKTREEIFKSIFKNI